MIFLFLLVPEAFSDHSKLPSKFLNHSELPSKFSNHSELPSKFLNHSELPSNSRWIIDSTFARIFKLTFEHLEFAFSESFFTLDNKHLPMQSCFHDYCQLDGVAMGPPLGPTLAHIFLCHFEKDRFSDWQ